MFAIATIPQCLSTVHAMSRKLLVTHNDVSGQFNMESAGLATVTTERHLVRRT